jgi:hypothetical protein
VAQRRARAAAEIAEGKGGWLRYRDDRIPLAYVRFSEIEGRFRPTEVYVPAPEGQPLDPRTLRNLPLGEIEAWANDPENAQRLRLSTMQVGPDLRTASAYYSHGFGSQKIGKRPNHWVEAMLMAQDPRFDEPPAPMPKPPKPLRRQSEMLPPLRVTPAAGRDHGEDFYREIARMYGLLTRNGTAPAPALAAANGVKVSTVHRWIKEARRRGHLPPARRGKAG